MPDHLHIQRSAGKNHLFSVDFFLFRQIEEKAREWDIAYIKKNFPQARFGKIKNVGHGGLAPFHPEKLRLMEL